MKMLVFLARVSMSGEPMKNRIATRSAVNGTTNVTTAPAAPVTDFALDEILEHQNRFTHPKFRIGSTLG